MTEPVVVSYGGGVNSTALLVGLHERGERPDLILFADTGGEREETYAAVDAMRRSCRDWWGISIETVSNADPSGERHGHRSLEDECLHNVTLPSLAFGFKGCSAKWKRQPMDRRIVEWAQGRKVVRLIGIDADESHRSANLEQLDDPRWSYRRPLIEWGWGREECVAACERGMGLVPLKSACWFCPAMKKGEVLRLAEERRDLFERAVAMERNAAPNLGTVRGLGRRWSWEDLVKADRAQGKLFPEAPEMACMCFDGEEDRA